jgi:pimeloyl-ACP methyl ester carboxylesterase
MGRGPVDVVGHSYGGLCALGAARRGAPIRRLILFEPPIPTYPEAYYPSDLIAKMRDALARGDRDGAMEAFMQGVFRTPPQELGEMKTLAMWQQMVRSTPIILRELESVDCFGLAAEDYPDWNIPTLLILGGDSPPQYRATIEALNAVLRGSQIAVLEGQQHTAIKTAPDLFAQRIVDFLTGPVRQPGM